MDGSILKTVDVARHGVLFALLVAALYTDLAWGKIHNWLVYPALAFGLSAGYLLGDLGLDAAAFNFSPRGAPSLAGSVLGGGLAGGALFVMFVLGGLGGGDVKLMAAVGTLLGLGFSLWALFFTSLAGGALALCVLIWKGRLFDGMRGTLRLFWPWRDKTGDPERVTIPYGVAIAIGTMWAWWEVYGS